MPLTTASVSHPIRTGYWKWGRKDMDLHSIPWLPCSRNFHIGPKGHYCYLSLLGYRVYLPLQNTASFSAKATVVCILSVSVPNHLCHCPVSSKWSQSGHHLFVSGVLHSHSCQECLGWWLLSVLLVRLRLDFFLFFKSVALAALFHQMWTQTLWWLIRLSTCWVWEYDMRDVISKLGQLVVRMPSYECELWVAEKSADTLSRESLDSSYRVPWLHAIL